MDRVGPTVAQLKIQYNNEKYAGPIAAQLLVII